ncbi:hypothetical protein [Streptomyces sp. NPDC017673]|uniref:hypothetical protein n=1 Tax=unclassified Streptomyces TaxID=2593676 RepID=UPI0037A63B13
MMRDGVLSDRFLRGVVQAGLLPLRVIATVYWLLLGWFIHRPDHEERETLRIARAAAAAGALGDRSEPTAAEVRKQAMPK